MPTTDPLEGVRPELRSTLERRGYATLTPVQRAVLDGAAGERNLRISSQTGSGKTIAVGFALAPDLLEGKEDDARRAGPLALIITPTRELASQVREELEWLLADVPGLATAVVTGGADMSRERKALRRNPQILVATPGRLLDHMRSGNVRFDSLRHVALDEADQMLDMGFREELDDIIAQLPEARRSHLISATFPPQVRRLADAFQRDALVLQGSKPGEANEDIEHIAHVVRERERYGALVNSLLLLDGERCLVFVQRRIDTADLAERLAGDGFSAMPISGDLSQAQRTRALEAFRTGLITTLVATDVAARGIDVADIAAVVHMDLPRRAEEYIHRSGRTGRAGKQGRSIALVTPSGRRRAERMFDAAKLQVTWAPLTTAKKIEKTLVKRWRKKLHARLAEESPDGEGSHLEYARHLLQSHAPDHLVASLLDMAQPALPRRAFDLTTPPERTERPERSRGRDPNRHFVRFAVTWGSARGATPARLLAQICRRGDISSADVGAMDVGPRSSAVEVAEHVAAAFERKVKHADDRDAAIRIFREEGEPGPSKRLPRKKPGPGHRHFGGGRPRKGRTG